MNVKITLLFLLTTAITSLDAQPTWSGSTPGNIFYNSGNVGIGVNSVTRGTFELYTLSDALPLIYARQAKNWGGSTPAFYFMDDRGYSGVNAGTTLKIESWSTQASAGALADFITLSNGVPISRFFINNSNGNIGIGHNSPRSAIDVVSSAPYPRISVQSLNGAGAPGFDLRDNAGNPVFTWHYDVAAGFTGFYQEGFGNRMVIASNGNVLIGKTSQPNNTYKLDVNGSIRSNEIVVNVDGSDFVFESNYRLKPLHEVEDYIKANKHLPDVKSAEEMQKNGLALGEMDMKLLQKVEELTLYIIDLKKNMDQVQKEVDQVRKENEGLKQELSRLKKD